jgi:hypothetical protein
MMLDDDDGAATSCADEKSKQYFTVTKCGKTLSLSLVQSTIYSLPIIVKKRRNNTTKEKMGRPQKQSYISSPLGMEEKKCFFFSSFR